MARGYFSAQNSAAIATGSSGAKTLLAYTAPATGAAVQRNSCGVDFGGTDSTAAAALVELVKGASGGTAGASVTPVATRSGNPTGAGAGTAGENYGGANEPSGGTVIARAYAKPYGQFRFPAGREIALNGSEMLGIRVTTAASVNAVASVGDIET